MLSQLSKGWKNALLALTAVVSIYIASATGLDQGLIRQALTSMIEAVMGQDEAVAPAEPALEVSVEEAGE